ncbi:maleylacetoacetate isomerase [Glycocaulis alkaliphilus]|uniref:Maleylacetoacetate isomerase n=1 Tax=Glycocaulis alkaliphilus TaxID=1434191 RepID=A0A3T0EAW9_9PROT|nr:maleylacetoacetate isomerase [Glycocaulis alkaliphilus]AZU04442.1 maleylacetoacetate isomerase [Glycocaulis alkaliphilus]GGB78405.1 maleylacetoacetate isomerase [Glycocaulis alkaliphilus]
MILHGYFRSSAAWRIRIVLGLKGIEARQVSHHLRKGEQRSESYLKLNPQGLVPALETDDGAVLTQSLAIIEYLDAVKPQPLMVPADPVRAAQVRAFALAIACEIHPLQNLSILKKVSALAGDDNAGPKWAGEVIAGGLAALEVMAAREPGPFCFGDAPTLADVCLVPQLGNARRFGVDVYAYPRLLAAEAACLALDAFANAAPDRQPDAE